MKTNKFFFAGLGFFFGVVFCGSTIVLLSFTNGPVSPASGSGMTPIAASVAHSYFNNYITGATPLNQVFKGFTIDKTQLDAMNSIANENPALTGFRIYLGRDNNSRSIGIVVGIDNLGMDAVKNTIYNTESQKLSPCPPICDATSPIIVN